VTVEHAIMVLTVLAGLFSFVTLEGEIDILAQRVAVLELVTELSGHWQGKVP
jgi:hypothetical protein